MAEDGFGDVHAPAEGGLGEKAVEKFSVNFVEDFLEVEAFALGAGDVFATAGLAEQMQLAANVLLVEVEIVPFALFGRDGFAEEFADQYIGKGFEDGSGGGFEGVGDADLEAADFGANGGVGVGETAEFNGEFGEWGAGANGPEDLAADFDGGVVIKSR